MPEGLDAPRIPPVPRVLAGPRRTATIVCAMAGRGSDPCGGPPIVTASEFDRRIEALGPASLLLVIERRMGPALCRAMTPEDILQEALLHAWRDRAAHAWQGLRAFRSWLLSIVDHRIADARDRAGALKRGGSDRTLSLEARTDSVDGDGLDVPRSTTPSRVAWRAEQAQAIRSALASLPEDVREVVRLRLVEQEGIDEIAARLALGSSAVRHRFRRGAEMFRHRLSSALGTQDGAMAAESDESATLAGPGSSPLE